MPGKALPMVGALGTKTIRLKLADTVQFAVMVAVVNVFPTREPLHVPPTAAVYPAFGVTVKMAVFPCTTCWLVEGLILPFAPAVGVIVNVGGAGDTVKLCVTAGAAENPNPAA